MAGMFVAGTDTQGDEGRGAQRQVIVPAPLWRGEGPPVAHGEEVSSPFRLRRARPLRWLAPMVRAFAELYEVERLSDVTLTVRIRARDAMLVQVRKGVQSWFVLVCADDAVYRASGRNSPLYPWVTDTLGCCPYGKPGCTDTDHAGLGQGRPQQVDILYTRVKGAWRHATCFDVQPYAA